MRLDPIIVRRFQELNTQADALAEQQKDMGVPMGPTKGWAASVLNLLQRTFGDDNIHYQAFAKDFAEFGGWSHQFEVLRSLFRAAREDYEGGYLFNIRSLAKAEVLSDALFQAKELLDARYKDPACILARVALESTLKDLCDRHGITHGKLDRMNADLGKAGVYNMAKQKQITAWAEVGNKAAHGEWSAYSESDARAMVEGVEGLLGDLL